MGFEYRCNSLHPSNNSSMKRLDFSSHSVTNSSSEAELYLNKAQTQWIAKFFFVSLAFFGFFSFDWHLKLICQYGMSTTAGNWKCMVEWLIYTPN